MSTTKKHIFCIENKVEQMVGLEGFMDTIADDFGLAPDVAFQLNLALDEALANSVSYAYPEGVTGDIHLTASLDGTRAIFQITEKGVAFDPTAQGNDVDTTLSAEERPIGGLGIFLIKQMMDEVSYERKDDTNVLTMIKNI